MLRDPPPDNDSNVNKNKPPDSSAANSQLSNQPGTDYQSSDTATDANTRFHKATAAEIISPVVLYSPSLTNLSNPAPILHLTSEDLVNDAEASTSGDDEDGTLEMSVDAPGSVSGMTSEWETWSAVTPSSMLSTTDDNGHFPDIETTMVNDTLSPKKQSLVRFRGASKFTYSSPKKRPWDLVSKSGSSTLSSDDDSITGSKKPQAKKRLRQENLLGPIGISQSATSSRKTREAAKQGEFEINRKKEKNWREKIKDVDSNARFFDDNVVDVTHFNCRQTIKAKEPYDSTRFRQHVDKCKGDRKSINAAGGSRTLLEMMSSGKWGAHKKSQSEEPIEQVPCRGLFEVDHKLIPVYLRRTSVKGGGARSTSKISLERFRKKFRRLTKKQKNVVDDIQHLEHQWQNDHTNLCIFSTACKGWIRKAESNPTSHCSECHLLLSNNQFKIALRKPVPADENYIYVNRRFQHSILGEQYARTKGLKNLIKTAVNYPWLVYFSLLLIYYYFYRMQNTRHLCALRKVHWQVNSRARKCLSVSSMPWSQKSTRKNVESACKTFLMLQLGMNSYTSLAYTALEHTNFCWNTFLPEACAIFGR